MDRSVLLSVMLALGACRPEMKQAPVETRDPMVVAPLGGQLGAFLERVPAYSPLRRQRSLGAASIAKFAAVYRGFQERPTGDPAVVAGVTLHGAQLPTSGHVRFPCPTEPGEVFARAMVRAETASTLAWGVAGAERMTKLVGPRRLQRVSVPVSPELCEDGELALSVRPPPDVWISEPRLLQPSTTPQNHVILISIDTLRADFWDGRTDRPEELQQLHDDSLRFRRAYAPSGTTYPSHRVMLSGLDVLPSNVPTDDPLRSIAGTLRAAGYQTRAAVGGGWIRAGVGFGFDRAKKRHPKHGFALGFEVYRERLEYPAAHKARKKAKGRDFNIEFARNTYTLAPSLEQSLRWFEEDGSVAAFHFLHGFDVHESRDVVREYWDQAAVSKKLDKCIKQVKMYVGDAYAVHWPNRRSPRNTPQGKKEECQRRLAHVMYDARVRSVQDMLGRYFKALRQMGVYDDALIVVTSDHGETLLDEPLPKGPPFNGRTHWGHNALIHTNLHVPLWIKPARSSGAGRDVPHLVGLVDLRRTIHEILGLPPPPGPGLDMRLPPPPRALTLWQDQRQMGAVLSTGEICRWFLDPKNRLHADALRVHSSGEWLPPTEEQSEACLATGALRLTGEPGTVKGLPESLREELEALGYTD